MILKESEIDSMGRNELCNSKLQEALFQRLRSSGRCSLRSIEVQVDSHRVVLSGAVKSYYLKQIAQESARSVCPERQVQNKIAVIESVQAMPQRNPEDVFVQESFVQESS